MDPLVLSRARTLQWLAALVAVCYHLRFLLFASYAHLAHKSPLLRAFYFFTSLGHEAFLVYMVVAGMLFGGISWPRWQRDADLALDGLALRLRSLYWWLVPALLVGGLLDVAGSHWFAASGVYMAVPQYQPEHLSLHTLAGNLLLLQDIAVRGYGSNAMLFLLTYEWWACAAAAAAAVAARRGPVPALAAAWAVGLALGWLAPGFFGYWFAWLAGMAAAVVGRRSERRPIGAWAGAALFAATVFGSRMLGARLAQLPPQLVPESRLALDILVALGAAAYLFALHAASTPALRSRAVHARLARLAPAVFAIHFPVMLFLAGAVVQALGLPLAAQPALRTGCAFALVSIGIGMAAWGLAGVLGHARLLLERSRGRAAAPRPGVSAVAKAK